MKTLIYYIKKYSIIIFGIMLPFLLIFLLKLLNLPTTIFVILSIIIILIFIKVCKDYITYGKKIFKFKSTLNYNELELISKDIEKINTYQKIIVKDNKIIVINKAGTFEFVLFNEKGFLKGNIKDTNWYLDDKKINNPFTIKSEFKYNYFIVNGLCIFKTDVSLVTKSNVYYEICKYLNKEVYNKEKIDEMYGVLYGDNKN